MDPSRRFRLGLLALISAVTFVGMLGFVLQGVLRQDRASYFILFEENVKGMVIGSKVNFQGVPFGMVKDIRFQGGKTLVELSVDPTRGTIQDVTRARLDRLLVTGQVTVELEGYGPEGKPLRPGQFIAPKADPIHSLTTSLPEMVPQITAMIEKTSTLLDHGNALLDADNRAAITAILQRGREAAEQLPAMMQRTDAMLTRADAALASMQRTADAVTNDVLPAGKATLVQAQAAMAELRQLQSTLLAATGEAQALLGGMRAPALAALAAVRGSLDELRGFARQLRLAPDSLLFGVTRPASPAGGER